MGIIVEDNVYYLRYLAHFVRRSTYIKYKYRIGEAPSINLSGSDKILVAEATYCTTVKQSLDGVGFSGVYCEDFYG